MTKKVILVELTLDIREKKKKPTSQYDFDLLCFVRDLNRARMNLQLYMYLR